MKRKSEHSSLSLNLAKSALDFFLFFIQFMLGFKVISKHHSDEMYAGQIIEYKINPVAGIPLYWMTEITHVEDKKYFIDEQRFDLTVYGITNTILKLTMAVLK